MAYRSEYHPEARAELDDAVRWYAGQSLIGSMEFMQSVVLGEAAIVEAPSRWPLVSPGVRRLVLQRYPYSIVYLTLGQTVRILAVAHARRKPGYWKSRLMG